MKTTALPTALFVLIALLFNNNLCASVLPEGAIPVKCSEYAKPGNTAKMTCSPVLQWGERFQKIPAGYTLQVTNVYVQPDAGKKVYGLVDVSIRSLSGTGTWDGYFRLRNNTYTAFAEKFNSPYFLITSGGELYTGAASFTEEWSRVIVTGFLIPSYSIPRL